MQRALSRLLSVGVSVLTLALGARATIVVDPAGGGDFTTISEAILAASDGEQILVKAGNYIPANAAMLEISGKGLSICAEAGAVVTVAGVHVSALPAGHWVILRGLVLDPSGTTVIPEQSASLRVDGPAGSVWAEDCTLQGDNGYADAAFFFFPFPPMPAVEVKDGGSLTLERCTIVGGIGWHSTGSPNHWAPGSGAPGVAATDGRVALHGCAVTGGDVGGGNATIPLLVPPTAGAGLQVSDAGFIHAAGCVVAGGQTGTNTNIPDDVSGDGLLVLGSGAAWVRDCVLSAGAIVNAGLSGQPVNAPPGAVTDFTAPARSISITSPLREGQVGTLSIQGQQGDQVVVLVALGANFAPMKARQGVFLLDTSVLLLPVALGSISNPGGALVLPFVTPNLNPVLKGLTVPMQLLVVHGGVTTIEGGTALAWLDSSL